jgi:uncharacterized membrane protein YvbJ
MALIKCSECGQEISDKAFNCPKCGNPLKDINKITQQSPVVIEGTKKKWKLIILLSVIFLIIGVILFFKGLSSEGDSHYTVMGIGIDIALLSFIGLIIGKVGAWWSNR